MGLKDGLDQGHREGIELGLTEGRKLGEPLGWMLAQLLSVLANFGSHDKRTDALERKLKKLMSDIGRFPMENEAIDREGKLDKLKASYKECCSFIAELKPLPTDAKVKLEF